jgi:hypothetical protein
VCPASRSPKIPLGLRAFHLTLQILKEAQGFQLQLGRQLVEEPLDGSGVAARLSTGGKKPIQPDPEKIGVADREFAADLPTTVFVRGIGRVRDANGALCLGCSREALFPDLLQALLGFSHRMQYA